MSSVQEQSEGSRRSEYNAQRQYVKQNIAEVFLELPLQTSVMSLVKNFDLETVRRAFESVESKSEDVKCVPQTQETVPSVEAEANAVHNTADLPTTTPLNTDSPCNNSISNLLRSRSTEDITRKSRGFEFGAGPSDSLYTALLSEPAHEPRCSLNGEAVSWLDAKNLESIFDGSDMKSSFEQMQGYSESASVKSFQTHETTINALNFAENMIHTMGERTRFKQKVAIVVLTSADVRLLVNFLKKEGFQSARIKEGELNTVAYDETVEDNQAVVLTAENWNALEEKYKVLTPYLIIAFPELKGAENTCGVHTLLVHTVERIPFAREDLPMSCASVTNHSPNIPLTPKTDQSNSPAIVQSSSSAPVPRYKAPKTMPTPAVNEELLFHVNERDSRLYYNLQTFARGVISKLTNEIRSNAHPGFEELRNEHYKTNAFVNQLQSWMTAAAKHVDEPCYCVYLLTETHNALTLVYHLGAENVKYLIAPHIAKIREKTENGRATQEDLNQVRNLEQILTDQLPVAVNFNGTEWFGRLVKDLVEDVKSARQFHGAIVVQSRVCIWATYELLRRLPDLKHTSFYPLYSLSKDPHAYDGDPGLRLCKSDRDDRLQRFAKSDIGILLVAVCLDGIETALPVLDSVIVFGCNSDPTTGKVIRMKKHLHIKTGGSTPGSTYEVMQKSL